MTQGLASVVAAVVVLCGAARAQQAEDRVHVWGRVEAPSGEPIAGATARIADAPGAEATTDAQGRFRIVLAGAESLSPDAKLVLSAPGRVPRSVVLHRGFGAEIPIGTHVLHAGREYGGRVFGNDKKPLASTRIAIHHGDGLRTIAETDEEGRYRAEGFAPGPLRFWIVDGPPLVPFLVAAFDPNGPTRLSLRTVPAGDPLRATREPAAPPMQPRTWVRGRVLDGGSPVGGARVVLVVHSDFHVPPLHPRFPSWRGARPVGSAVARATTAADGSFAIDAPGLGFFFVQAEAPGRAPARSVVQFLHPGEDIDLILVELGAPGASIEGRILVRDGTDAEGLLVRATRPGAPARFARSAADGRFLFEGLEAGPWRVAMLPSELQRIRPARIFLSPQEAEPQDSEDFRDPLGPDVVVQLADGATAHCDLDLRGFRTVRGQISFSAPGDGTGSILFEGPERSGFETDLDADGWFVLRVDRQGPATIEVRFSEGADTSLVVSEDLVLDGDRQWAFTPQAGSLEGRVAAGGDAQGITVTGSSVDAMGRRLAAHTPSRVDGSFEFRFLPAGTWSLCVTDKNGDRKDGFAPVQVRAGETTTVDLR